MYCRLYIIFVIVWAYAERVYSQECDAIRFNEHSLDDGTRIFATSTTIPMTWYQAVCCCRKRGWELMTPMSNDVLQRLNGLVDNSLQYGWMGAYYNNGHWRYLSGEIVVDSLVDVHNPALDNATPRPGKCIEFLSTFRLNQHPCDTVFNEAFICEDKGPYSEPCPAASEGENPCKEDAPILIELEQRTCPRPRPRPRPVVPQTTTLPTTTTAMTTTPKDCSCCLFWNIFSNC